MDKKADVWVTLFSAEELVEYAHGGTELHPDARATQAIFSRFLHRSENRESAAANFAALDNPAGGVAIYADAKGTPTLYSDSDLYLVFSVGYDNKGNLFADGETSDGGSFAFAELPRGSSTFVNITLNQTINTPGAGSVGRKAHHRRRCHRRHDLPVKNLPAQVQRLFGSTTLGSSDGVFDSFIDRGTIIGPNVYNANAMFSSYPAGGSPDEALTGFIDPFGAAVSKGKK